MTASKEDAAVREAWDAYYLRHLATPTHDMTREHGAIDAAIRASARARIVAWLREQGRTRAIFMRCEDLADEIEKGAGA